MVAKMRGWPHGWLLYTEAVTDKADIGPSDSAPQQRHDLNRNHTSGGRATMLLGAWRHATALHFCCVHFNRANLKFTTALCFRRHDLEMTQQNKTGSRRAS